MRAIRQWVAVVLLTGYVVQTSKHTKDISELQKGADFVKAFALGFDVNVCACAGISSKRRFHLDL